MNAVTIEENQDYGFFCDLDSNKGDYPEQKVKIVHSYKHNCLCNISISMILMSGILLTYSIYLFIIIVVI
jgi:hypothetical protein